MANSAPPVQDYMLQLAAGRLTPEKFALLQYKLATGSRAAIKIMHAIKPGEWESAVGDTREFNDIRCRLETALHAWIHSNPTSKGFVWPLPAPIQEPTPTPSTNTANDADAKFAQLDAHIAAFTRPDPIVRKKPTIVFVTDRRQPAPGVDKGQQTNSVTVHTTKGKKNHHLAHIIIEAQKELSDKFNTAAVWANLQALAAKKFSNLLGETEDGIQYPKKGETAYFTKDALAMYLKRQSKTR